MYYNPINLQNSFGGRLEFFFLFQLIVKPRQYFSRIGDTRDYLEKKYGISNISIDVCPPTKLFA